MKVTGSARSLCAIAIVVASVLGLAAPAGAATDGQDPNAAGCSSGAVTVRYGTVYGPNGASIPNLIELRYNSACVAGWTRLSRGSGCLLGFVERTPGGSVQGKGFVCAFVAVSVWTNVLRRNSGYFLRGTGAFSYSSTSANYTGTTGWY